MGNSQTPIYRSGNMEVLPALGPSKKEQKICRFPDKCVLIDISPPGSVKSTRALEKVIHMLFPHSSENELAIKNGRLYLGSKRVGTISESASLHGKMRIWLDDLVKSKLALEPQVEEDFPKDRRQLSSIIPLSSLLGILFTDSRTLIIAIGTCKYAVLVSEGFDEVRIEFHNSKRGKPDYSFLVDGSVIHRKTPPPQGIL